MNRGFGWRLLTAPARMLIGLATTALLGCAPGELDSGAPLGKTRAALDPKPCDTLCAQKTPLGQVATSIAGTEWSTETIGSQTGATGCACYDPNTGTFTVASDGQGPGFSLDAGGKQTDQAQFVYADPNEIPGVDPRNLEIVVRVVSSELSSGVMIREGMGNCDRMAAAWHAKGKAGTCNLLPPGVISGFLRSERIERSDPVSQWPPECAVELSPGGSGDTRVEPPYWLRLQRFGDDYSLSRRRDGGPWVMLNGGVFKPASEENVRIGFFAGRTHAGGGEQQSATFRNVYVGRARSDYRTSWLGSDRAAFSTGFTSLGTDSFYVAPNGTSYKYYADPETSLGHMIDKFDANGLPVDLPNSGILKLVGTLQGGIAGNGDHLYVVTSSAPTNVESQCFLQSHSPSDLAAEWTTLNAQNQTVPAPIDLGVIRVGGLTADSENIYVSDRTNGTVRVFDLSKQPVATITLASGDPPGALAVDHRKRLWIARTAQYTDYRTSNFGKNADSRIECIDRQPADEWDCPAPILNINNPTALAIAPNPAPGTTVDPANDQLLVALNGPDQNIRIYGNLDGSTTYSTLGVVGGVFAGSTPGLVSDPSSGVRFFSPVGVGVDSTGNRYVASSAPRVEIQKFSAAGTPQWVDPPIGLGPEGGGFDPAGNGNDFYTSTRRFALDLSSAPLDAVPGSEWSSKAVTWNPFLPAFVAQDRRFQEVPTDLHAVAFRGLVGGSRPLVRRLGSSSNKQLFLFMEAKGTVTIYRFEGEIAKPCGALDLAAKDQLGVARVRLWIDADGQGDRDETIQEFGPVNGFVFDVDQDGNIWLAAPNASDGIYRIPNLGMQAIPGDPDPNHVVPTYDLSAREYTNTPEPFPGLFQYTFFIRGDGDRLFLYGSKLTGQAKQCGGGTATPIIARYDDWHQSVPSKEYALPDAVLGQDGPQDFTYLPWDKACGCTQERCDEATACAGCTFTSGPNIGSACCGLGQPGCECGGFDCSDPASCGTGCSYDWALNAFDVAGDFMFLQEHQGPIHVIDVKTGAEETRLSAGPELSGWQSWADPSNLMSVFHRSNGEYLVTTNDTSRHARTILFRWQPPWTPKRLAPLAWYHAGRAASEANTGDVMYDDNTGGVVRWHDRSGNGRDLVQSSAGHRPIYSPAGWNGDQPTVSFDGTTSVLERNPWPTENPIGSEEPYTILAVMKASEVRDASIATWWGTGGLVGAWLDANGENLNLQSLRVGGQSDNRQFTGSTNISTKRRVLAFRYKDGKFRLSVNGATEESSTVGGVSAMTGDRFLVGWQYPGGGTKFKGDLSELIVVPREIDEAELAQFQAYAETEWGGFDCVDPGDDCLTSSDCCDGACVSGVCSGSLGDDCEDPGDCQSGFCVDAICCESACTSDDSCIELGCTNIEGDPGTCLGIQLQNGTACDDGNSGTSNDQCEDGVCTGGAWGPPALSPTAWYFASSSYITDAGSGAVSQWSDRSGNGHHVAQSNGCCQPTFSATGWNGSKPTLTFDGATSVLDLNPWPTLNPIGNEQPYTVLAVMKASEVRNGSIASWWGTGGLVGAWLHADSGSLFLNSRRVGGYGGDREFTGSTNLSTNRHVLAFRYNGAGVFSFKVDNGPTQSNTPAFDPVTPMSGGSGNNQLLIGWQDAWGTTKFKGDISEIVVVPTAISDTDVSNFRTYAQGVWGGL